MIKVGEHITLDFIGVKKDYSPEFYEKVIYKIAKAAKVEILNVASHKFEPQGFTLVALLSESHFSFHTFPERGVISFDFFTCGKVNPKVALKILRNEIQHERVVTNTFDRSSIGLYDDIYSTPGQKKYYVVKNVLEKFTSKVGQFVEVMDIEEFGNALFIDHEIQVAEKDENVAEAVDEYVERAVENADVENYTLADTVTEVQVEAFIENPIGELVNVNIREMELGSIGSDMTSDQKEKAQEVVVPIIIASQIVSQAGALFRRLGW